MPPLPSKLRNQLEKAVVRARDAAEEAAGAALTTLAVERNAPFPSMSEDQRRLRHALRAKARQLGGGSQAAGMTERGLLRRVGKGLATAYEIV